MKSFNEIIKQADHGCTTHPRAPLAHSPLRQCQRCCHLAMHSNSSSLSWADLNCLYLILDALLTATSFSARLSPSLLLFLRNILPHCDQLRSGAALVACKLSKRRTGTLSTGYSLPNKPLEPNHVLQIGKSSTIVGTSRSQEAKRSVKCL